MVNVIWTHIFDTMSSIRSIPRLASCCIIDSNLTRATYIFDSMSSIHRIGCMTKRKLHSMRLVRNISLVFISPSSCMYIIADFFSVHISQFAVPTFPEHAIVCYILRGHFSAYFCCSFECKKKAENSGHISLWCV